MACKPSSSENSFEDFGRDFSAMLSSDERPEQVLVEGIELNLPAATAIPLGFIVSELITNAAKYGDGRIAISLQPDPAFGYALSVSNGGPALPEGFDPGASTGLGMRIIQSFTRQIGGELRIGRGDDGQGARFTVLFPGMARMPFRNAKPGNNRNVGIKPSTLRERDHQMNRIRVAAIVGAGMMFVAAPALAGVTSIAGPNW